MTTQETESKDRRRHPPRDGHAPAEPKVPEMKWSVYIVRCRDGALYTGIATDVLRRLEQHARPGGRGAKSLRGRGPLSLAARRVVGSRSLAQSVESRIKALSRPRKLWLIAKPSRLDRLVASAARASRSAAGGSGHQAAPGQDHRHALRRLARRTAGQGPE